MTTVQVDQFFRQREKVDQFFRQQEKNDSTKQVENMMFHCYENRNHMHNQCGAPKKIPPIAKNFESLSNPQKVHSNGLRRGIGVTIPISLGWLRHH